MDDDAACPRHGRTSPGLYVERAKVVVGATLATMPRRARGMIAPIAVDPRPHDSEAANNLTATHAPPLLAAAALVLPCRDRAPGELEPAYGLPLR